jgi:hypothetical protein
MSGEQDPATPMAKLAEIRDAAGDLRNRIARGVITDVTWDLANRIRVLCDEIALSGELGPMPGDWRKALDTRTELLAWSASRRGNQDS